MTKLYGVTGDPIAQSLSPLIHRGWMREHKLDAEYLAMHILAGEFEQGLETLARRGIHGLNVTLPHKENALAAAVHATDRARTIGAANTLWRPRDGTWHADNTDAPGFLASLGGLAQRSLKGQRVLVFGAGGSARAIVYALHSEGASIILANRTLARAEELIAGYGAEGASLGHQAVSLDMALEHQKTVDFIVNTTSLGYSGGVLELAEGHGRLFYDISYGAPAASITGAAQEVGWTTADGVLMLVYQAAFSFERWFGIMPDIASARDRVQRAVDAVS